MSIVKDIKDRYVQEIREELSRIIEQTKKENKNSPNDYIYRTGIITGLEKALSLIEEYEK